MSEVIQFLNVNLNDLSDDQLRNIATYTAYSINVIIPEQELTKKEYSRILRLWGLNPNRKVWCEDEEYTEIIYVTNKFMLGENKDKQGLFARGELEWHCNGPVAADPEDCVTLYCYQPTTDRCDTKFLNGIVAYNTLPKDVKKQLENTELILTNDAPAFQRLKFDHFIKTKRKPILLSKNRVYLMSDLTNEEKEDLLRVQLRQRSANSSIAKELSEKKKIYDEKGGFFNCVYKKIIHKHRLTGITGLYYPFTNVMGYHDIPEDEWTDLHEFLSSHYIKFSYSHEWKRGDVVLFDNTQGLHKRDNIPLDSNQQPQDRELWRGAFWYDGIY